MMKKSTSIGGIKNSYMAELDSNNMYEMVQGKRIKISFPRIVPINF